MISKDIQDAMWAGDTATLQKLAPCCCDEHTSSDCPAREWFGCPGQNSIDEEGESWARLYEKERGMSRDKFFGG